MLKKVREHVTHQPGYFREGNLPRLRVSEMDNPVARLGFRIFQRAARRPILRYWRLSVMAVGLAAGGAPVVIVV